MIANSAMRINEAAKAGKEARLLEVELAMEAILPKIKAARWKAMSVAANAQLNG